MTEDHAIVSRDEWDAARKQLLEREKELTRLRYRLSEQRRSLPWVRVEKQYVFDGPNGKQTLAELFEGRSQLVVYHFMFGPEWEAGCKSCSFWADNYNGAIDHLAARDTAMVAISRAPYQKLEAFKRRMGWNFKWLSSGSSDFNYDYQVSFTSEALEDEVEYNYAKRKIDEPEWPGVSVFYQDGDGNIFHTYSAYSRGIDLLNSAYNYLDLVPKGRDESELEWPMAWVRHHDKYDNR